MPTPLDTLIPPPIVAALCGVGIRYAAKTVLAPYSLLHIVPPEYIQYIDYAPYAAGALAAVGVGILGTANVQFRKHKTTVTPLTPAKATTLVQDGVFARTRNPMYLGMAFILSGYGLYVQNPLAGLAGVATFVAYITQFQIKPEESALKLIFNSVYDVYVNKVPRWI